jgi:hypothetical protein
LYFTGIAPSATAALSNAQKAFITCGARLSIFFNFPRVSLLYMQVSSLLTQRQHFLRLRLRLWLLIQQWKREGAKQPKSLRLGAFALQ